MTDLINPMSKIFTIMFVWMFTLTAILLAAKMFRYALASAIIMTISALMIVTLTILN